jgi:hypothetical protein
MTQDARIQKVIELLDKLTVPLNDKPAAPNPAPPDPAQDAAAGKPGEAEAPDTVLFLLIRDGEEAGQDKELDREGETDKQDDEAEMDDIDDEPPVTQVRADYDEMSPWNAIGEWASLQAAAEAGDMHTLADRQHLIVENSAGEPAFLIRVERL